LVDGFPEDRRDNRLGVGLLAISGAVLTIEVAARTMLHVAALSHGLAVVGGNWLECLVFCAASCGKKLMGFAA
jgi:hypothetical protein